ncbi:MAG: response regulator transcription factor [Saprospiraceae bacterium]
MPVKILIYEDNDHLRNSLCSLFQWNTEYQVLTAKSNPSDVLNDIAEYNPDVILMDIEMPVTNGIQAVELIRGKNIDTPVIMLTIFDDNDNIYNAICAGASGYLLKHDFENLVPAIREVLNGGAPMSGSVAKKILNSFSKPLPAKTNLPEFLTKREVEILTLLVHGHSYKMIADSLHLSIDTIRTHIKKIYKKLHVNSATEAIFEFSKFKILN